jgi:prepilin-type N-terminal cleavage/methylation domain-containing protein
MKSRLGAGRNTRGFSISELVLVMAVFGILAAMALPQLLSYLRVATSNAARDEMRAAPAHLPVPAGHLRRACLVRAGLQRHSR